MNALWIILLVAAIIIFFVGIGNTLHFLWVVAGILLVIAIIVFLLRFIRRNV